MQRSSISILPSWMALALLCGLLACKTRPAIKKTTAPEVAVISIDTTSLLLYNQFSGILEGIANIEIRPQVDGYLQKIFIEEGSFVHQGDPLFQINDNPYTEQLNTTHAALLVAQANARKAAIEVDRLTQLVAGNVISPVVLENAQAILNAANASISQAQATRKSAAINKAFTLIKAPVSGYIGRIPYKIGSLIGRNETQPLTVLSDIHEMYAYFSMSEKDFLRFKQYYAGNTVEEKIRNIPPVALLLPDNTVYPEKGKVDLVQGQFNRNTAAITFRASFPNAHGLLRSGNTGTVILPQLHAHIIQIPQAATFEMQNKVMAFAVSRDNKLRNIALHIAEKNDTNYIIRNGLQPGDRIVARGVERLHEGMEITPVR